MKFTIVFITLLCVSTSWAVLAKKTEDPKDKREAAIGYGVPGLASHSYQAPAAYSQGDASAISVGAGYSIGGSKPNYVFGDQGSSGSLQIPSEGLSPNGHATIQLAPITLQSGSGAFATGDLSQLMSQITHSLNAGGLSLQPSNAIAEYHQGNEGAQGFAQGQGFSGPQFTYGAPKYELSQQLSQQILASAPAYSTGAKGLNSYSSTGPVLFAPSESQSGAPAAPSLTYGAASSGHSLGDAGSFSLGVGQSLGGSGHSFGGSPHSFGNSGYTLGASGNSLGSSGHSLGGSGPSFGSSGHSLGSSGHSLGGAAHSLGSSGHALGGSGHSLAGLHFAGAGNSFGGSYKQLSGSYGTPSKTSFKPSTFLGASIQGESGHGISSLSGSYGAPSFGSFRGGSHGLSLGSPSHGGNFVGTYGSSKPALGSLYQSIKPDGLESASALSSGYIASPPATTYGIPGSSYSANNAHAASSNRPHYVNAKHYHRAAPASYGQGGSSYRAPVSAHSSLGSYSKYSHGGSSSPFESSDAHGSASETSYNTIKYSEDLKPRIK